MYDLLLVDNTYQMVPRGTASEGKFVCVVSAKLAEELGWKFEQP